jgi:hypothetical protein
LISGWVSGCKSTGLDFRLDLVSGCKSTALDFRLDFAADLSSGWI